MENVSRAGRSDTRSGSGNFMQERVIWKICLHANRANEVRPDGYKIPLSRARLIASARLLINLILFTVNRERNQPSRSYREIRRYLFHFIFQHAQFFCLLPFFIVTCGALFAGSLPGERKIDRAGNASLYTYFYHAPHRI